MDILVQIAVAELARFLNQVLPPLSPDWWEKHVVARLTFQQQRLVAERDYDSLEQLDLAGLLRVLDQNWYELTMALSLPREGRSWVKEMQTVRNKWAHLSSEALTPNDVYRDADTLERLLIMIGATQASVDSVTPVKSEALAAMAGTTREPADTVTAVPSAAESDDSAQPLPEIADSPKRFAPGDLVTLVTDQATVMPVIAVLPGGTERRYVVFRDGIKTTYYETQLKAADAGPEEASLLDANSLRARLTSIQILSPSATSLFSLRSGRIQFISYQYRPVLRLIRADRPRLLIADEVGVGKTIEAGLVIKELQARSEISSILILCPKSLVAERKWEQEMRRFDEHFTPLDGQLLRHCMRETEYDGEWPSQYAKAIVPFSLLDSNLLFGKDRRLGADTGLLQLEPAPAFDLVIVDEAHHIRNSETLTHQAVRFFCDHAEAVLFLTATPIQMRTDDLFTLLNVLRPDLIIDQPSFEQMAEPNPHINEAIRHCRRADSGWMPGARSSLDRIPETEWGRLFLVESPSFQAAYDRLSGNEPSDAERVRLIRDMEELYTFSPLINRTRRRDIGEFTMRKPKTVTVEFSENQRRLYEQLMGVIARIIAHSHGTQYVKFLMSTVHRQAASCLYGLRPMLEDILQGRLRQVDLIESVDYEGEVPSLGDLDTIRKDIDSILRQARELDSYDPKVEAFVEVVREKATLPRNKSLVFSTFRHTLAYLASHLQTTDLRFGVVHGDIKDEDRSELRRRFALDKEHPDALDLLLSSEVGCEGLDYQFCDLLVNYDLPWNPMRIEQRIGRLDRFGQESDAVVIVNLVTPDTVDADIYERCLMRIGVFERAVGGSEEILGELTETLRGIAQDFALTPSQRRAKLKQLAENQVRQIQEEEELEASQAELFGLNIPNQSWREEIEAAESLWLSPKAIEHCARTYLADVVEQKGDYLLGDKPAKTLRLNQEHRSRLLTDYRQLPRSHDPVSRRWEQWLRGGNPTLPVTFDQETAAIDSTVVYLTVLHPLVRQAANCLGQHGCDHVALAVESPDCPIGAHPFAVYLWQKAGVLRDEMLVAVARDPIVENKLMDLLLTATDSHTTTALESTVCDELESLHHRRWVEGRANHVEDNRRRVEHRKQSLRASHQARRAILEDQIARANNDKIRLMKESELARAQADYNRKMADLAGAAESGDLYSTPLLFGTLTAGAPT